MADPVLSALLADATDLTTSSSSPAAASVPSSGTPGTGGVQVEGFDRLRYDLFQIVYCCERPVFRQQCLFWLDWRR